MLNQSDHQPLSLSHDKLTLTHHWPELGWRCLALAGWILIIIGLLALNVAGTIKFLPYELTYLGTSVGQLNGFRDGNLTAYMAHNRVSFGGALLVVGLLYIWLAHNPIRRGEPWAWWTLLLSGTAGVGSYFSFLSGSYIDLWHGLGTVFIAALLGLGLGLSKFTLQPGQISRRQSAKNVGNRSWVRFEIGRIFMLIWALGSLTGGILIMLVGMLPVFVPEDLEYLRTNVETIYHLNDHLVPFISHDRAGFGGALLSGGIVALGCVWFGLRAGQRKLLLTLVLAWLIGTVTEIGIHPIIGYNSFSHLLPMLVRDSAFLVGFALLYKPVTAFNARLGVYAASTKNYS